MVYNLPCHLLKIQTTEATTSTTTQTATTTTSTTTATTATPTSTTTAAAATTCGYVYLNRKYIEFAARDRRTLFCDVVFRRWLDGAVQK